MMRWDFFSPWPPKITKWNRKQTIVCMRACGRTCVGEKGDKGEGRVFYFLFVVGVGGWRMVASAGNCWPVCVCEGLLPASGSNRLLLVRRRWVIISWLHASWHARQRPRVDTRTATEAQVEEKHGPSPTHRQIQPHLLLLPVHVAAPLMTTESAFIHVSVRVY